jgi:hypothetical protein
MHVHASQFNPSAQMDAIFAAAKAEAQMAAAQTRKKLIFSASAVANDIDGEADCVVSLSGEDTSRDQSDQQDSQSESGANKQSAQTDPESNLFSDWA